MASSSSSTPIRTVSLPPLHEFSFELEPIEAITVTLLSGTAEVFGFELVPHQPHPFGDELRAAVWTSTGCELQVKGKLETSYVGSENPVASYLALHLALTKLRAMARPSTRSTDLSVPDDEVRAPRVLVVGERGAGKTSLIKSLLNWRVRETWAKSGGRGGSAGGGGAILVNLDVAEGGLTLPGTVSLVAVNALLPTTTPVNTLGTSASSGPPVPFPTPSGTTGWTPTPSLDAFAPPLHPLIYWFGHQEPNGNLPLYEHLLKRVGASLNRKLGEGGMEAWKAGAVIDTPGEWAEKKNLGMVSKAVRAVGANIVLVVGNQRLEDQVKKLLDTNKTVTVVRVPSANGASEMDEPLRQRIKDAQIRSYFYGGPALTTGVLSPFSIIVKFEDLNIVRVGEALSAQAPDSALPIGFGRTVGDLDLVPLDLTLPRTPSELLFRVLGIPQAAEGSSDEVVVASSVLGWVFVSAIDQTKKKVTLLSPLPGRLPRKTLLLGSVDWQDN